MRNVKSLRYGADRALSLGSASPPGATASATVLGSHLNAGPHRSSRTEVRLLMAFVGLMKIGTMAPRDGVSGHGTEIVAKFT